MKDQRWLIFSFEVISLYEFLQVFAKDILSLLINSFTKMSYLIILWSILFTIILVLTVIFSCCYVLVFLIGLSLLKVLLHGRLRQSTQHSLTVLYIVWPFIFQVLVECLALLLFDILQYTLCFSLIVLRQQFRSFSIFPIPQVLI